MANPEHLEILKQGVEVWNQWREDNPEIKLDLSNADLSAANLSEADLRTADLKWAYLSEADLNNAILSNANLNNAKLSNAKLSNAKLNNVSLDGAVLCGAYLKGADLSEADLNWANLNNAKLSDAKLNNIILNNANLSGADLSRAYLKDADFTNVKIDGLIMSQAALAATKFVNNDLSKVIGLNTIKHRAPSSFGIDTLQKSKGKIPEKFLRGCGLSDLEIEFAKLYNPDLTNEEITNINYRIHDLRVSRAFQINPLFISYSHRNTDFVDAIEKLLINEGIRFWRDIHDAKAGRLEKQIDAAIQLNDVVLLIFSEHSTNSDWVEHEARKAREKEKKTGKDAMCPIALDESWKTCRWPKRLREQIQEYNILDFSKWHDASTFQMQFSKLVEGLNLFYK